MSVIVSTPKLKAPISVCQKSTIFHIFTYWKTKAEKVQSKRYFYVIKKGK